MVGVVILTATYKNYGIAMIFDEVILDDLDEELTNEQLSKTVSKVS